VHGEHGAERVSRHFDEELAGETRGRARRERAWLAGILFESRQSYWGDWFRELDHPKSMSRSNNLACAKSRRVVTKGTKEKPKDTKNGGKD